MRTISAKNAKYHFGELVDLARAEPVTVAKYGRPVVVVIAVEEYERLVDTAKNLQPRRDSAELGGAVNDPR